MPSLVTLILQSCSLFLIYLQMDIKIFFVIPAIGAFIVSFCAFLNAVLITIRAQSSGLLEAKAGLFLIAYALLSGGSMIAWSKAIACLFGNC